MNRILKFLFNKLGLPTGSTSSKKIFINAGWLFFERILNLLAGLFVGVWVTRYLGPERFGLYSYALSFSVLFTSLASFGIDQILVRDLVKFPEKKDQLISTGFFIKLFGSVTTLILALIIVFILGYNDEKTGLFIIIVIATTAFQSFSVIDMFFQSTVESKKIVKANTIVLVVGYLIKIFFILNDFTLLAFILIIPLEAFIRSSFYLFAYRSNGHNLKLSKFDLGLSKSMIAESWPLILSGFAISMGMRIDQIMLKEYLPVERLGIYSVGVRLAELFSFLPIILMQSLFPKITTIHDEEDENIVKLIRYVFYLLCFLALIISFSSKFVVNILYGIEFTESYKVLIILIWTIPLTFLGIITNALLTIRKFQKTILLKQLALTFINISLNLIFIPKFGILGAAFATLLADFFINFFIDLFLKNARWIFFLKLSALTKIKFTSK